MDRPTVLRDGDTFHGLYRTYVYSKERCGLVRSDGKVFRTDVMNWGALVPEKKPYISIRLA